MPESRFQVARPDFSASIEGEARLLLLIDAFSRGQDALQGRTKLAKLDFLLRYPAFFHRALMIRNIASPLPEPDASESTIEQRMVRFRYGPWDPAYYALLGSLVGRGLIRAIPQRRFIAFQTTEPGRALARNLASTDVWSDVAQRARLLKRAFPTQGGTFVKDFIYLHFPEVTKANWGERL